MDAHPLAKLNIVVMEWSTTTARSSVTLEIILELAASTALSRAEMELSMQARSATLETKPATSAQQTVLKSLKELIELPLVLGLVLDLLV
jgi:hypothetical protein